MDQVCVCSITGHLPVYGPGYMLVNTGDGLQKKLMQPLYVHHKVMYKVHSKSNHAVFIPQLNEYNVIIMIMSFFAVESVVTSLFCSHSPDER